MLEPCEVKVSCTVLRGLGSGNTPRLPDDRATCAAFWKVSGSGKITFYLSFWGLKSRPLSSPLAIAISIYIQQFRGLANIFFDFLKDIQIELL